MAKYWSNSWNGQLDRCASLSRRCRTEAATFLIHRAEDPAVLTERGHRGAELVVLARF